MGIFLSVFEGYIQHEMSIHLKNYVRNFSFYRWGGIGKS